MKTQTKLRKAYKAVVYPSEEAVKNLWFISRAMAHLWNLALVEAQTWLETTDKERKRAITAYSFNYWLTGARQSNVVLKDGTAVSLSSISSDLEREVLRKLAGSYQSFFELKKKKDARARMPSAREEERFQTLSWSSFTVKDGILSVPGMDGKPIVIPLGTYLTDVTLGKDVVHATIASRDGSFELSLVTATPLPTMPEKPTFFRSIDLGAGNVAVTDSDGSEFLIPLRRPDKHWRPLAKKIERRIEKLKKKDSRRWRRLMKGRRRIWKIAGDQLRVGQRKLADALVEDKIQCIIIGKAVTRLGLAQSKTGTNDQHWGAQNTGYLFRLLLFIQEKAQERGIKLVKTEDPVRLGDNADPNTKFNASRSMLSEVLTKNGIGMPVVFIRKHFKIDQGRGDPHQRENSLKQLVRTKDTGAS